MNEFLRKINKEFEPLTCFFGFILAIIGVIWGFHVYIYHIIDERVKSPEIISLISSRIRPVIIFDSEKRIIYGKDALKVYLQGIDIKKEKKEIKEIIIDTKDLLSSAPILESLDEAFVIQEPRRDNSKWVYELEDLHVITDDSAPKPREVLRFRLEFIE